MKTVQHPVSDLRSLSADGARTPPHSVRARSPQPGRRMSPCLAPPLLLLLVVLTTMDPALAHRSADDGSCCHGTAQPCADMTDEWMCAAQPGCTWDDKVPGTCSGSPTTECGSVAQQRCKLVPGCVLDTTCVHTQATLVLLVALAVLVSVTMCFCVIYGWCDATTRKDAVKKADADRRGNTDRYDSRGNTDRYDSHVPLVMRTGM